MFCPIVTPTHRRKEEGTVCPIVTPTERTERKQIRRGMVCKVPIFIQSLQ